MLFKIIMAPALSYKRKLHLPFLSCFNSSNDYWNRLMLFLSLEYNYPSFHGMKTYGYIVFDHNDVRTSIRFREVYQSLSKMS